MNSVGASGLAALAGGGGTGDPLSVDGGGGGGPGDSVTTHLAGTSDDDDDDMASSPGSFDDDEGSLPGVDDVTAQLAAAGGWSGEMSNCVFCWWWREPIHRHDYCMRKVCTFLDIGWVIQ